MSNIFVEGFGTYGVGSLGVNNTGVIGAALLAGRWAALDGFNSASIGQLPWAPTDADLYLSDTPGSGGGYRVVMPSTSDPFILSLYFAVSHLPNSGFTMVASFNNGSNQQMGVLAVTTTGALALLNGVGVTIAETSGPVLTAESAAHIELEISPSGGTFQAQVNGNTVINATGLTFSNSGAVAQLVFIQVLSGDGSVRSYIGNIICRNTSGTVNNAILGDRRVATLFANGDDLANQGWAGRPLQRFGTGILDNTGITGGNPGNAGNNIAVMAAPSSQTDIGGQQFTIEGNFRFQALPSGSNKATLFSKWDLANNHMSYELYVGGPSLETGNTVFRITTDGKADTLTELISWTYVYEPGEWYHIAVARDGSNDTRLFINGILQGLAVSDANTYYSNGASGAPCFLGAEGASGTAAPTNNTSFNGWQDEFRLTIGVCRYTANFAPPSAAFPRGSIADPDWSQVAWLSGWDSGSLADDSGFGRALVGYNGAAAQTPNDGEFNFQTVNKVPTPNDNTFIEAQLVSATGVLTYSALPTTNDTVTIATTNGSSPAVYTWVTALTAAFQVLKSGTVAACMSNLAAAVNAGAGAGTVYGSGTTANNDVSGVVLPSNQLEVTANIPGTAGNSLATSTTDPNGAWGGSTLSGGLNIPGYSQFIWSRLPSNTTIADSITLLNRTWKTDAGTCSVQASLVGHGGGVENGGNYSITTAPTFYSDVIEHDPDNVSNPLTPTSVLLSKVRINRTT